MFLIKTNMNAVYIFSLSFDILLKLNLQNFSKNMFTIIIILKDQHKLPLNY